MYSNSLFFFVTIFISSWQQQWAQRSDSLYITIALPDVTDETINLTDTELHFKGTSEGKPYEVNIKFYKSIDSKAEGSTYKVLPRSVQMHVMKAASDSEEFWPRLLEDKHLEKNQVAIDWNRYVDEDEEEDAGGFDTSALEGGNMFGGMGGGAGGGMGGMDMEALMRQMGSMENAGGGGMPGGFSPDHGDEADSDDEDDDDDDLPDLE